MDDNEQTGKNPDNEPEGETTANMDGEHAEDEGGEAMSQKTPGLKQATSKLKAEALRRYKERHRSSLDRHEQALEEQFGEKGRQAKKSPSPGLKSPDIIEEDVFLPNSADGQSPAGLYMADNVSHHKTPEPFDAVKGPGMTPQADLAQVQDVNEPTVESPPTTATLPADSVEDMGQDTEAQPELGQFSDKQISDNTSGMKGDPQQSETFSDNDANPSNPSIQQSHSPADMKNRTPSPHLTSRPSSNSSRQKCDDDEKPGDGLQTEAEMSDQTQNPAVAPGSHTEHEGESTEEPTANENGVADTPGEQPADGEAAGTDQIAGKAANEQQGDAAADAGNDVAQPAAGDDDAGEPGSGDKQEAGEADQQQTQQEEDGQDGVPTELSEGSEPDQQQQQGEAKESKPEAPADQKEHGEDQEKDDEQQQLPATEEKTPSDDQKDKETDGEQPAVQQQEEATDGATDDSDQTSGKATTQNTAEGEGAGTTQQEPQEPSEEQPSRQQEAEQTPGQQKTSGDQQIEDSSEQQHRPTEQPPEQQSSEQPQPGEGEKGQSSEQQQKSEGQQEEQPAEQQQPSDSQPAQEISEQQQASGDQDTEQSSGQQQQPEPQQPGLQQGADKDTEQAEDTGNLQSDSVKQQSDSGAQQQAQTTDPSQVADSSQQDRGQPQAEEGESAATPATGTGQPDQQEGESAATPATGTGQPDQQDEQQTTDSGKQPVFGQQEDAKEGEEHQAPADGMSPTTRGDEYEIESEEIKGDEQEEKIPEDFCYTLEDHISVPMMSDESGLPKDLLTLHHSFGYDCQKRSNLHILDENTAVFAAGNVVELLNLQTKEQQYIRSTSGGGIGAIAVHPSKRYFAVAEKGSAPNINIFLYPSLRLFRILRGGTEKMYSYVDFSPDGRLLASVGGDPDFMLTLWDWKQEKIVLRSKAFSQDIFRVTFSTELEGQLTSAGTGHIRFWKMARTFTGLKLQGALGKFGKTEISDIEGYVELPDGKVLSGCEWGNMLLWDGGLIKVEISRKGRKPCHNGSIQQIIMDEGELLTVGIDGYIRVWDFETIDTADVTDETAIFEMEPMNELKVGNDVNLRSIVKCADPDEPTVWYGQDANGGIWKMDLSFSFTSQTPEKLVSYHAGTITGCSNCPNTHLVATTGLDKTVRVYDYIAKQNLCYSKFNSPGSSLLWLPSVVDPKGASILAGFDDGVVRLLSFQKKETVDVHGRKHTDQTELALAQAFKPHNGRVTCMAVDSKGEFLATGSDDKTVFFLSPGKQYEPIGFIKTPAPVSYLHWSPGRFEKNTLLISCTNGHVQEVSAPEEGTFDTSHSFQISGLATRTHIFKSVKSHLRHEEELARKAREEEERRKQEEEERRLRIERGLETESEAGEQSEEKVPEEEEEWEPYIPAEPSPILCGFHAKNEGKFWLSMGEFDAGYLYECEFLNDDQRQKLPEDQQYEPTRTISVHDSNDSAVHAMTFSKNEKYLVMGLEDGSVRVQPLLSEDVGLMGPYWSHNIHDNHSGKITHVSLSYDDRFLFTVGCDGNFFTFQLMDDETIKKKIEAAKAKIPSARKELSEIRIDDIEDPNAYSIEDAKQKSEHDKTIRLAEEKKMRVRSTIAGLRYQFRGLLERNHQLPEHLRLHRKEFELDAEIKQELERQKREKIAVVQKEMAWEEEKHRIALDKIRARFKDVVECERIVVKAFCTPHEVSSFRASKLSDDFYAAQAEMERRKTTFLSKDDASRLTTQENLKAQSQLSQHEGDEGEGEETGEVKVTTSLKGSMGERITKALAKVEEKKRKRAHRRSQWAELYDTKPDDNYEDPADVAAIKQAQDNMGDYKLKSADDYVVPDHLRMNTDKARQRLLLLKDLMHEHKYDFNQKLLALRDKKLQVISDVTALVMQLQEVQSHLHVEQHVPVPSIPEMSPEEMPEKKYEYTRETLLQFKEELDQRQSQGHHAEQSGGGGFGGFGAGAAPPPPVTQTTLSVNMMSPTPTPSLYTGKQPSLITMDKEPDWFDEDQEDEEDYVSELEKRLRTAEQIRYVYQRDQLLKKIEELLKNFDAELRCLRHDKFKLDIDMKNADLRHVTLFEELLLLKDFEKRENVLADKVEARHQEKLDMQAKVADVQSKLESKKKDIEKLQEREKALLASFGASLGENNKFADYLTKVFKKKIKRSKKKATEGEGSEDESDEDSDDESDWSESEEESDSEAGGFDLDVCPAGCDQNLYDNTCALREKRLDIEEALAEEKKNRDTFNKELEGLQKKAKVIDSTLKSAENELEAFQLEKQRKLNELDVVVSLKLHQVQYMMNGALPTDLAPSLVFEASGVVRLQHRIKELEHEKALQKKQQKEAKKKHVHLIKDRRHFQQRITEMDDQCEKMMLQKFGRVVDLEKLEQVTVNRQIEELKDKLRQHEMQCSEELNKWDAKIAEKKEEITELIRENTRRLQQLNMLLGEKKAFEHSLDSRQKNLGGEFSGARKADVHERQQLVQLVHLQAQEIDALKEEITLLARKGGHILPPAQPPLPSGDPSHPLQNT